MSVTLVRSLLVLPVLGFLGCFYDSSWGQETTAQKHAAEAARPASLAPAPSGFVANAKHVFKVRVWATAQYGAQTVDWKHETREVVEAANRVLLTAADTRLEIASMDTWDKPPAQDELGQVIQGLRAHDRGEGAGWVIGLVGSFPTYTASYHQLGMGMIMGRHLVLRAAGDLGEHEAVEAAFTKLDPSERMALVAERKRHRSVATLLHEIGHTLGAVHEEGSEDFMGPAYSKNVHTFGPAATQVVKIGIAHHDDADVRPFGAELLHYYEGATTPWLDKERLGLIADLKKLGGGAPEPKPAPKAPPELKEPDVATWTATDEAYRAGKLADAWKLGQPLFAAYPNVLAVQDLRCQIAMKVGFDMDRVRAECALLMKLSTGK